MHMCDLAKFTELCQNVLPNFDTETCSQARAIAGEDVLTLRTEEHETQLFFVDTPKKPHRKMRASIGGRRVGGECARIDKLRSTPRKCPVCRGTLWKTRGQAARLRGRVCR